jgi:hypothetical protein
MQKLHALHPASIDYMEARYDGTGSWTVATILMSETAGFITTEA